MSAMAEVIARHVVAATVEDDMSYKVICFCGFAWTVSQYAEHVADVLTKAGYGNVREARAAELETAMDSLAASVQIITTDINVLRTRAAAIRAGAE